MLVRASDLTGRDAYRFMIACVVPRPIGWVSTLDDEERPNLAPFSFFGGVTTNPPTLMLSVGRRKGGHKDTARNLLANGEAVVHVPTRDLAERMVRTSADLGPGEDEFEFAGLTKVASDEVAPFRVAEAAIAMETRLHAHQEVGHGPVDLFLLEVLRYHVRDEIVRDGRPDPALLAAVGRLGGLGYCDTSHPFDVERPPRP
jgi:flavin reductase (DIM6/NTAB) family NADH-FMN oxidoreductase RutF